jgi:NAD(P)-dependent dehydrogenase (short-subunit alcohol dehydrogenase family)
MARVAVVTGGSRGIGEAISKGLKAAGYKVARGETALDGSNPTPVATGLTTIVAATLSLKGSGAPGVGTSALTYDTSGGTLNIYAWKVTSNANPTLIASTGTETVGWFAVGT